MDKNYRGVKARKDACVKHEAALLAVVRAARGLRSADPAIDAALTALDELNP